MLDQAPGPHAQLFHEKKWTYYPQKISSYHLVEHGTKFIKHNVIAQKNIVCGKYAYGR